VEQPDAVLRVAGPLLQAVAAVTLDEQRSQDARFDRDSRRGRELLFMMANSDWLLETREIVRIDRSAVLATTVEVKIDLGLVTHEAFRESGPPSHLPLLTLPLVHRPGGPAGGDDSFRSGVATSLTVADQDGRRITTVAQAEVYRRISAALAEIILNMAAGQQVHDDDRVPAGRPEKLLLSAALYRFYRRPLTPPDPDGRAGAVGGPDPATGNARAIESGPESLKRSRRRVQRILKYFVAEYIAGLTPPTPTGRPDRPGGRDRTDDGPDGGDGDALRLERRTLTAHAAQVLFALEQALFVVVPVERPARPAVYRVDLPGRRLVATGNSFFRRPRAHLAVDLLFPASDADRQFQLHLPDGVACETSRTTGAPAARAAVVVERPASLDQLHDVMAQLLGGDPVRPDPFPVTRFLADLAVSRIERALGSIDPPADEVGAGPAPALIPELLALREDLIRLEHGWDPGIDIADLEPIRARWRRVDPPARLRRPGAISVLSPSLVEGRLQSVDPMHRATPIWAEVTVDVAVTDSELFSTARLAGMVNLILMVVVMGFLVLTGPRSGANIEVIATALTLFAVIQAGRLAHPDHGTFRGALSATGYWLVIPTILPTVVLALALAFVSSDQTARWHRGAIAWTAGGVLAQLVFQLMLHRGPLAVGRVPEHAPGYRFTTVPLVDHARTGTLHTEWWSGTTADALLLGREAYAYLIAEQQGDWSESVVGSRIVPARPAPGGSPLRIDPTGPAGPTGPTGPGGRLGVDPPAAAGGPAPANVLALLRAGAARQALNFVVFRDEPAASWLREREAVPIRLATDQLSPHESPKEYLDVYVGIDVAVAGDLAGDLLVEVLARLRDQGIGLIEVQLPVPPPPAGSAGRRWLRVRGGVQDSDLPMLRRVLLALHAGIVEDPVRAAHCDLMVQGVPQAAETYFSPRDATGDLTRRPVLDHELDALGDLARGCETDGWCVLAVCGPTRPGLEAGLLAGVRAWRPRARIVDVTSSVLYGTSVSFLLLRHPGVAGTLPEAPSAAVLLPGGDLQVPWARWQTARQVGRPGLRAGPLLRVNVRAVDRPALAASTLAGLEWALLSRLDQLHQLGRLDRLRQPDQLRQPDRLDRSDRLPVEVWHAQVKVREGSSTSVRLIMRLSPELLALAAWRDEDWQSLERDVQRAIAADLARVLAPGSDTDPLHHAPIVVIRLLWSVELGSEA
jgi:hypothetical protein